MKPEQWGSPLVQEKYQEEKACDKRHNNNNNNNHESTQPNMNSISKSATKIIEELSQPHVKSDGTQHTMARLREVLKEKWKNKVMHGQYIRVRNMDRQLISEEDTLFWLSKGDPKAETESEIVAAQDQALQTKYCATKILSTET